MSRSNRATRIVVAAALLPAVVITCAGCPKPTPPPNPKTRFQGVELRVLIERNPRLEAWITGQRGEWTAETGGNVEVAQSEAPELRAVFGLNAAEQLAERDEIARGERRSLPGDDHWKPVDPPAGDIVIYPSAGLGAVMASDWIVEAPKTLADAAEFERSDIAAAVLGQVLSWNRKLHALPLSASCQIVYFRRDLLADETNQREFEAKFGHALRPPATWTEFDEIATFFDGRDFDGDGAPDLGVVVSSAADAIVCRAAAYGKHPDNFSFYFDQRDFEPLLTSPAFELALAEWLMLVPLRRAGAVDATLREFESGHAALALGSSLFAGSLLRGESAGARGSVTGKVGCVPLPGSPRVYDFSKKQWLDRPADKPNRAVIVDGVVASVLRTSTNQQAAFHFLGFFANRSERNLASVTSREYGFGPYRLSQFVDPVAWTAAGWSSADVPGFLKVVQQSVTSPNAIGRLRINGAFEYLAALDRRATELFSRGASGGAAGDDASLTEVVESWRRTSEWYWPDRQNRQYRYSLGVPVVK